MAKVTIKRRNDAQRADGCAQLYATLYIERKKLRIPIDVAVSVSEWDADKEIIKGRSADIQDKNLIISNVKAKISDILVKFRLTGEKLTRDAFLRHYNRPNESRNFITFIEQHINELITVLKPQTRKHHLSVLKKLRAYNQKYLSPRWRIKLK